MKLNHLIMLIAVSVLVSCGSDSGGGSGSGPHEVIEHQMTKAEPGTYYAVLRPVNFNANGFIPYGSATFTLNGDQLQVNTTMDDDQAVPHRQSLHIGSRCPKESDDRNGDGFVDYDEAMAVVGPVLMPLDNDLNSQEAGANVYPRGRAMTYSRSASLARIHEDLWLPDTDPSDDVMKLAPQTYLGLERRVVLIHGTSYQAHFPSSLSSYKGEEPHLSLPVVCGVLSKIN